MKRHQRCCAEVGSVKHGWRSCNKPAVVSGYSQHGGRLYYCETHENRATNPTIEQGTPLSGQARVRT